VTRGEAFRGEVAQLVEHATENRGVGSSILPLATTRRRAPAAPVSLPQHPKFLGCGLDLFLEGHSAIEELANLVGSIAPVAPQRPYR
jgi:hypothetical protein